MSVATESENSTTHFLNYTQSCVFLFWRYVEKYLNVIYNKCSYYLETHWAIKKGSLE